MIIKQVNIIPYSLPFRQSWQTNRTNLSARIGWLVKMTDEANRYGYGDCAPLAEAGTEEDHIAYQQLLSQQSSLIGQSISCVLQQLPHQTPTPAARCAIETALLDLLSQAEQQPLRQYLNPNALGSIRVNSMLGPLATNILPLAQKAIQQGFNTLKIKIGMLAVQEDIRLLRQLIEQLPEHIQYRLDANGSWSYQDAELFIQSLAGLNIESIEEPLQQANLIQLRHLQDKTHIALALDESINKFDLKTLLNAQAVKRLILKPTEQGGLLPSIAFTKRASEHDTQVIITSSIESAIGIQATAQLAAALSDTSSTHGLATSEWLVNNVATPPAISNGILHLNDKIGLGLIADE